MIRHSMARVSSASFDEDYCGAVPTMVAFNWESAPGKPLKPLPKSCSISKRTSTSSTSSVDKSPLPLPPGRRILQQSHLQSFSGPLFSNSTADAAPTKPSSKQSWGHKLVRNSGPQEIIRSQSYCLNGELEFAEQNVFGSERLGSTRFNPAVLEVDNCASGRRNASATLTDLVELTPVVLPPGNKLHAMDDLLQVEVAKEDDESLPLPPGRRPKDGFYLQYPRPGESMEAYESSGKPRDPRKLHTPKKLKKLLGWPSKQQFNSAGRVSRRDARDAGDMSGEEEEGSIEYLDVTNSQESEVAERLKARLSKKIAALRRNRPHIRKCFHFEGGSTSPGVRSPRVHHSEKLSRGGCRPHSSSSSSSRRKSLTKSLTLSSVKNPCVSEADEEKSDLSELHTSATAVNESTSASSLGHDTSRSSHSSPDTNSSRGLGCTSSGAVKPHHHVADPYACLHFPAENGDHHQQPGQKHQPSCKFMANMLISLCPSDGNEEFVAETLDGSNSSSQLKEIASPHSSSARRNYSGSSSSNLNPILLSKHTEESSSSPTLLKLSQQQAQEAQLFPHQRTTSKVSFFCNSANSKNSLTTWRSAEREHRDGNFIPDAVFARGGNSTTKELLHQDSEAMSDPGSQVQQQLNQRYSVSEKSLTSPTIRSNHGHSELSRRSMLRSSSKLEQRITLPTKLNEESAQTPHADHKIKPTAGDPGDVQGEARKFSKSVRTTSPRISPAGSNSSSPKDSSHALGGEIDLISPNSSSRMSSSRLYSPSKLRSLTSESRNNSLPSQEDPLKLENHHQQPIYPPEQIKEPVILPPAVHAGDQNAGDIINSPLYNSNCF
jgi:hypothetical protein